MFKTNSTKKTVICSLLFTVIGGCSSPQAFTPPVSVTVAEITTVTEAASKTILVKVKNNLTRSALQSFESKHATKVKRQIKSINVLAVELPQNKSASAFLNQLKSDPAVVYAEPDIKIELDKTEVNFNDPMLGEQYALSRVEASKAWATSQGKETVKIAIIDTGVDLEHPDLKDKLLPGYNSLEQGKPPKDDARHGTHVAGISAAIGNNGIGVSGLAPKCKIIPVKALGASGGTLETVSDGLVWAADNDADVVNMSLGSYTESKTLEEAVKYALSKNVVLVATMGNNSMERKRYPAAYPGMIAVGATDSSDKIASYSNFGPWMTVSAPGTAILSTLPTYMSPNGYGKLSGTSMAAPLVAGLAALVRSQNPGLSPDMVSKKIQDSADDLGDSGFDKYYGAGRINAFKAMNGSR